jgi:beta-lactam-binding protein with PASTA domain
VHAGAGTVAERGSNGTDERSSSSVITLGISNGNGRLDGERATITLDEADDPGQVLRKPVAAGAAVTLLARVRNQSTIVDEFELRVFALGPSGGDVRNSVEAQPHDDEIKNELPGTWWDAEPSRLHLMPFGTGGLEDCESETVLRLHPPRAPGSAAGTWSLKIVAHSRATDKDVASTRLDLDVQPYTLVTLEATPPECKGKIGSRTAAFELTVTNRGNRQLDGLSLEGSSRDGRCKVGFTHQKLDLDQFGLNRGEKKRVKANVRVQDPLPFVIGRNRYHFLTFEAKVPGTESPTTPEPPTTAEPAPAGQTSFADTASMAARKGQAQVTRIRKLAATGRAAPGALKKALQRATSPSAAEAPAEAATAEGDERPTTCTCTFIQRPWLPWWTGLVVAALLAGALAIYLAFFKKPLVVVPDVIDNYVSHARSEIDAANLNDQETAEVACGYPHKWQVVTGGGVKVPLVAGEVFEETTQLPPKATPDSCIPIPTTKSALAGQKIRAQTTVYLLTAVKPGQLTVPDLHGLAPIPAAEGVLSAAGLTINDIEPFPPNGLVIVAQSPAAHSAVTKPGDKAVDVWLGQLIPVPSLPGESPAAAEQKLKQLGFVIHMETSPKPPVPPIVAAQSPAAGQREQAGTTVNVWLGTRVPKLKGLSQASATNTLHARGLKVGVLTPHSPSPADRVVDQAPISGSIAQFEDAVNLTFAAPPPKRHKPPPHKPKSAQPKAATQAPVPALGGATAASAAATLAKSGVRTKRVLVISAAVPAGRLIGTTPRSGTKVARGSVVTLTVSAGYPEIAVDNGHEILALSGVTGHVLSRVAAGPEPATQPTWSPSGEEIAYISGGRILITPANAPNGPTALTQTGQSFTLPTFPNSTTAPAVIAAIQHRTGQEDRICLLAVAHPHPSCIGVPEFTLGSEIAWSPHGTELLVGASRSQPSPTLGLVKLTSSKPFSTSAQDWKVRGLVTPTVSGAGVLAAAFSPDGLRLAVTENFGGPFSLALTTPSDLTLAKAQTFVAPTPACEAQWRTDSQQLLVESLSAAACTSGLGTLYRVDPARPSMISVIATRVADPSWQPLPGIQ